MYGITDNLNSEIFVRIIRSGELRVHFTAGSQWSVSREIVLIKQTVRIISGWIKWS